MQSQLHSGLDFPLSIGRKLLTYDPGAPSPVGNQPAQRSGSYVREPSVDPHLVLILMALLGFLIFALGVNSFLKYLLRCRRRTVMDSSDGAANSGMQMEAMKALPILVYTAASKPQPVTTDCPICLGEFVEGEKVRVLPNCNHTFHLNCIDKWLVSHSSCPMCRDCLNPGGAAIAEATESNNGMHIVVDL